MTKTTLNHANPSGRYSWLWCLGKEIKKRLGLNIWLLCVLSCSNMASAQDFEWAKDLGEGINRINGLKVLVGVSGDVYVYGMFADTVDFDLGPTTYNLIAKGQSDFFIAKYDINGNLIWAKGVGGPQGDNVSNAVMDSVDNIYVCGYFRDTVDFDPGPGVANLTSVGTVPDGYIAKYDSSGNYEWAGKIGRQSAGSFNASIYSLDLDANGNIYCTGDFNGNVDFDPGPASAMLSGGISLNAFVAKYDNNGNYIWALKAAEPAGVGSSRAKGITVNNNKVSITGSFYGTMDFNPGVASFLLSSDSYDAFVAQYDTSGVFVWAGAIASSIDESEQGNAIVSDAIGNLYITGVVDSLDTGGTDFDPGTGVVNIPLIASAGEIDHPLPV